MEIFLNITVGVILITGLLLLIMVFKNEGVLAGVLCFILFPVIYYFAIYDFKKYSIPFVVHVCGFLAYWMAV